MSETKNHMLSETVELIEAHAKLCTTCKPDQLCDLRKRMDALVAELKRRETGGIA